MTIRLADRQQVGIVDFESGSVTALADGRQPTSVRMLRHFHWLRIAVDIPLSFYTPGQPGTLPSFSVPSRVYPRDANISGAPPGSRL